MAQARVTNFEAIQEFKAALVRFGVIASGALGSADMEIRRTIDYVNGQLKYWQAMVRKREEELTRAKTDLSFRKSLNKNQGGGVSELEKAVYKAQQRVKDAEEKVRTCQKWQRALPEAILEYQGPARLLSGMLDSNLRMDLALLDQKLASLEAYIKLTAPSTAPTTTDTNPANPEAAAATAAAVRSQEGAQS
jgi:hypothetical protein